MRFYKGPRPKGLSLLFVLCYLSLILGSGDFETSFFKSAINSQSHIELAFIYLKIVFFSDEVIINVVIDHEGVPKREYRSVLLCGQG